MTIKHHNSYISIIYEKIIIYTIKFISIASLPLSVIAYLAIEKSECLLIKFLPFLFTAIVLMLFFFKKIISINFKSSILIAIFYFVGIYTLLLGLLDMASLWFILAIIFAFYTKSKELPIIIFSSAFLLTMITGILMISKNPQFPIDYGFKNCQFACVTIRIINFLIIGFLIFKILKIFFETVELYIQEITEKNIVLEQLKATEQKEAEQNLKNQILKSDIEKHQLEIDYKRKELTDAFSKILKFNSLLNDIKKDIADQNYKNAIANLTVHQTKNYDIETFLFKFNEIYPDFLIKLQETYTQLTETEVKVCVLISAELKSSEIGNLLNVSETSIGKYRNRIRKKLNLENNTDIAAFLFENLKFKKYQ